MRSECPAVQRVGGVVGTRPGMERLLSLHCKDAFCLRSDGVLAVGHGAGALLLRDSRAPGKIAQAWGLESAPSALGFSPDGERLVLAYETALTVVGLCSGVLGRAALGTGVSNGPVALAVLGPGLVVTLQEPGDATPERQSTLRVFELLDDGAPRLRRKLALKSDFAPAAVRGRPGWLGAFGEEGGFLTLHAGVCLTAWTSACEPRWLFNSEPSTQGYILAVSPCFFEMCAVALSRTPRAVLLLDAEGKTAHSLALPDAAGGVSALAGAGEHLFVGTSTGEVQVLAGGGLA